MKIVEVNKHGNEDITIYDVVKIPNRIESFFGMKKRKYRYCVSNSSGYITKERL
jgi:tRNA U38,U39,U40 pseudouridine synthase TruA